MRRILFSAGWFAAGLVTIPLLMWGVDVVEGRSVGLSLTSDTAWSSQATGQVRQSTCRSATAAASCGAHHASPPLTDSLASADDVFADDAPAVDFLPGADELVQATPEPFAQRNPPVFKTARPVAIEDELPMLESNSPQEVPAVPAVILPVTPEMLASGIPTDEAETAKLTELRDALKKVIEEKAAMLSATALEAEIALHQRHLADLQALQELLKLQQSLKELSDKYPNSDAGRRAAEMLQLLIKPRRGPMQFHQPTPDLQPRGRPTSDGFVAPPKKI